MRIKGVGHLLYLPALAISGCATAPPDPAAQLRHAMVFCARHAGDEYLSQPNPKIYFVTRTSEGLVCKWMSSGASGADAEAALRQRAIAAHPDAQMVAINDEVLVAIPPPRKKHDDGTPSWFEILAGGAASVASAAAGSRNNTQFARPASFTPGTIGTATNTSAGRSSRGQYANTTCARLKLEYYEPMADSNYYTWENVCSFPIEVAWCWNSARGGRCKIDNLSRTLPPGDSQLVVGGGGREREVPSYVVCDMSHTTDTCSYD